MMANSFQSCAKPIISHPEPVQAQVKLAKLKKKDGGHPGADTIYNHTLKNTLTHIDIRAITQPPFTEILTA